MIDPALVARVRAEVAAGIDPAGLLAVYAEPARRALLRERVRAAARAPLTEAELDAMCAELFGFGPLQQLLDDPLVTDVLVNGPRDVFCERSGRLDRFPTRLRHAPARPAMDRSCERAEQGVDRAQGRSARRERVVGKVRVVRDRGEQRKADTLRDARTVVLARADDDQPDRARDSSEKGCRAEEGLELSRPRSGDETKPIDRRQDRRMERLCPAPEV